MTDRNIKKKWEAALDLEAAARTPTRPDANDPVALEAWFTLRASEFAAQKMGPEEIERAMARLADAEVVQSPTSPVRHGEKREKAETSALPLWSTLLDKVVAALRPDLALPAPSLRSSATGFEPRVFETDRFAITIAPDAEGGRGSILPRQEASLPRNGIARRYNAAGEVLEERQIDETGVFRFEVLEAGDRVELQIGEQWIEVPLLFDS